MTAYGHDSIGDLRGQSGLAQAVDVPPAVDERPKSVVRHEPFRHDAQRMKRALLSILVVIGMVLAPFLPAQRLYICSITGTTQLSCCCHLDPSHATMPDDGISGCCKVVTVMQFLASGPGQPTVAAADATPIMVDLPEPQVIGAIDWPTTWSPPRLQVPPPRQRDPMFIAFCSHLT